MPLSIGHETRLHVAVGIVGSLGCSHAALIHGFGIIAVGCISVVGRVVDARQHFSIGATPQRTELHRAAFAVATTAAATFAFAQAEKKVDNQCITNGDSSLLVSQFVLACKLPRTFGAFEWSFAGMQHLVARHMLRSRELFAADVTRMIVMLLRCPAKKTTVDKMISIISSTYTCEFSCALSAWTSSGILCHRCCICRVLAIPLALTANWASACRRCSSLDDPEAT